jgi:F-type H+-transporting ATPase subunit b
MASRVLFLVMLAVAVPLTVPVYVAAHHETAAQPPDAHAAEAQAGHEAQGEEAHEEGWLPTVAKIVNFAILAGVLVYFLKTPLVEYLGSRITKVREDLVAAASMRETASRQLADIEAKLKALPAELEALKARGAEEIAAERVRIREAAEAERQRLLEHTRREIDMRLRVAKRELVEHAADLAVAVASERIKRSITPDDQARLVDRFTTQLTGARA